jgi:hypothetical protein
MSRLRYDGLKGTLGAAHNDSTTTLTLTSKLVYEGGDVPTIAAPDYLPLSILDSDGLCAEIVHVTAYTSPATTATMKRAQERTTASAHDSGATFVNGPTTLDFGMRPDTYTSIVPAGALTVGQDKGQVALVVTTNPGSNVLVAAVKALPVAIADGGGVETVCTGIFTDSGGSQQVNVGVLLSDGTATSSNIIASGTQAAFKTEYYINSWSGTCASASVSSGNPTKYTQSGGNLAFRLVRSGSDYLAQYSINGGITWTTRTTFSALAWTPTHAGWYAYTHNEAVTGERGGVFSSLRFF